ncbi:chemotaxis protein CheW [Camelliibacillus cellulosilyticus]|uniref:Chemotaxis protein CheW n=1 Tax=Camelliibacillus cellulosilyticus TaxID=2174486 RepID=A0ABV9GL30_9BACL
MGNSKVVVFSLNGNYYGVPVEQVLSIEKPESLTRVPKAAPFIKGVVNLHGLILPVIDLQTRFGIGQTGCGEDSRLLVIQVDELKVAFIVDQAKDVLDIDETTIESTPELIGGIQAAFIHGVAKTDHGLLILLNLLNVLKKDDIDAVKELEVWDA